MRTSIPVRLATAAAIATMAATVPVVLAAPASAATGHFVRFSNKSAFVYRWCVRAYSSDMFELKGDCDKVGLRQKSTFFVPADAKVITYDYADNTVGGESGHGTRDNNRDWCFRASGSGSVHEATDQPCTLK